MEPEGTDQASALCQSHDSLEFLWKNGNEISFIQTVADFIPYIINFHSLKLLFENILFFQHVIVIHIFCIVKQTDILQYNNKITIAKCSNIKYAVFLEKMMPSEHFFPPDPYLHLQKCFTGYTGYWVQTSIRLSPVLFAENSGTLNRKFSIAFSIIGMFSSHAVSNLSIFFCAEITPTVIR